MASAIFVALGPPVLRPSAPAIERREAIQQPASQPETAGIEAVSAPARVNYAYSVIPGGARDPQDLARAIQTDEVVADHYRDVDPSSMRVETVLADRMAHVSYRLNDRVYWTKKPVRIYEGETILTNGETEIRGRCGNAISLAPLLPTSDEEPDSTQFDALTDTGPLLVAFNWPLSARRAVRGRFVGGIKDPGGPATDPGGPTSGVGGGLAGPAGGRPFEAIPADPSGFVPFDPGDLEIGLPESNLPTTADSSRFDSPGYDTYGLDPSEGDPSEFGPLVLQPLLPESDPPTLTTINPTPVPEPATLVLIGSGLAGLLARHRRKKAAK